MVKRMRVWVLRSCDFLCWELGGSSLILREIINNFTNYSLHFTTSTHLTSRQKRFLSLHKRWFLFRMKIWLILATCRRSNQITINRWYCLWRNGRRWGREWTKTTYLITGRTICIDGCYSLLNTMLGMLVMIWWCCRWYRWSCCCSWYCCWILVLRLEIFKLNLG